MIVDNKLERIESDYPKPILKKQQKRSFALRILQVNFAFLGTLFPRKAANYAFKIFTTPRGTATHKRSDRILESARVFEFMFGKYLLKGYEWGKGEKLILLVHGWGSRGTALRSFVPGLVEQGYRVVAFDGPAHGNSPGKRTTLPQFSSAIQAIIRHLNGVDGIITHSFGGASTVFALKDMEYDIPVNKLVLIAAPSSMKYMADSFLNFIKAPKSVAAEFIKILESKVGLSINEAQISKFYSKVRINNTLIVHDAKDEVVPFHEAEAVLEGWDSAKLIASDGYGHYHVLKNPDIVNRVVSFLVKA